MSHLDCLLLHTTQITLESILLLLISSFIIAYIDRKFENAYLILFYYFIHFDNVCDFAVAHFCLIRELNNERRQTQTNTLSNYAFERWLTVYISSKIMSHHVSFYFVALISFQETLVFHWLLSAYLHLSFA